MVKLSLPGDYVFHFLYVTLGAALSEDFYFIFTS